MSELVLSLFPGIGLLDMAFEEEGFCVVRGPDLLWGGDIRNFHPPAGKFDGVIGGPPCQCFSPIGNVNRARWGSDSVAPNLIPEFERVVAEASPVWWLMENVPTAPAPDPVSRWGHYDIHSLMLNNRWFGAAQDRLRLFTFGKESDTAGIAAWAIACRADMVALESAVYERTVSGKGSVDWRGSRAREPRRSVGDMLELQGFPHDLLDDCPLTVAAAKKAVGNGVPLPMGRTVARAVKQALGEEREAA